MQVASHRIPHVSAWLRPHLVAPLLPSPSAMSQQTMNPPRPGCARATSDRPRQLRISPQRDRPPGKNGKFAEMLCP